MKCFLFLRERVKTEHNLANQAKYEHNNNFIFCIYLYFYLSTFKIIFALKYNKYHILLLKQYSKRWLQLLSKSFSVKISVLLLKYGFQLLYTPLILCLILYLHLIMFCSVSWWRGQNSGLEHQLPSPQAFQTGFKVKAKSNRLHLSLKANLIWESLLKQKDSLPAVNDMRRVERLHHKTLYQGCRVPWCKRLAALTS